MKVLLTVLAIVAATSASAEALKDVKGYKALGDGLYTIADRSLACRVRGDHLTCANRFTTVVCRGVVCKTGEAQDYPRDTWVEAEDAKRPDVHVWKPGLVVVAADTSCSVKQSYIACVVEDPQGGFQMSGLFSRVLTWDFTPSPTWPQDGKPYTLRDIPCLKPSCQAAPRRTARSRP